MLATQAKLRACLDGKEKMVPVGGHGHLKSKRWLEITAVVHVKIK